MKATLQPQGMSASALSLKCDPVALQMALAEVDISIIGYFYAVDFRSGVSPQHHRVGKNAICGDAAHRMLHWVSYIRPCMWCALTWLLAATAPRSHRLVTTR
jgi:hypothetical protein